MNACAKLVKGWLDLAQVAKEYQVQEKKIVLTFGAFDIVHPGHVFYLEKARSYGDVLIVGITSDVCVRQVKGSGRPINQEENRALVVAGFGCVDHVFVFDSEDCRLIETVQPTICVYSETSERKMETRQEERLLLERYGGTMVSLPAQSESHSSDIIRLLVKEMGGN